MGDEWTTFTTKSYNTDQTLQNTVTSFALLESHSLLIPVMRKREFLSEVSSADAVWTDLCQIHARHISIYTKTLKKLVKSKVSRQIIDQNYYRRKQEQNIALSRVDLICLL